MAKRPSKSPPPKPAAAPQAGADLDLLKDLVALLDSSSATTIKLSRGDATYEVSRAGSAMPVAMAMGALPAAAPASAPAALVPAAAPAPAPSNLIEIKSPMVGTFYRAPEPGAEPYVKPGSRVTPGQTLCIIEAMKIMNEIESEVGGMLREILVEDAQPVEFGQVLFRVEPHG
jgi:acetyl-CoA carboxylase biotin carboxyl carrier protein